MFEITILASGSRGNATLVKTETTIFLVDAGLSARDLTFRLMRCGVEPRDLRAILVTHEHGDHIKALPQWTKQHETPIYCNRQTEFVLRKKVPNFTKWKIFKSGSNFDLEGVTIQSFPVSHDAVEPVGFVIRHKNHAFGFITDLGYVTQLVTESLRGVDALLIESNYDEELLNCDTKRPWGTKQRILSRHGHLSNVNAAEAILKIRHNRLTHILLGHLSNDCNSKKLALDTMNRMLGEHTINLFCALQDELSPTIRLD